MTWLCRQAIRSVPDDGGRRLDIHESATVSVDGSDVVVSYPGGEGYRLAIEFHGIPKSIRDRVGVRLPNVWQGSEYILVDCSEDRRLYLLPENEEARSGLLAVLEEAGAELG